MSDDQVRLAVLIDADNISAKVAKDVFEELAGYGTLTVKRAYGDWTTTRLNGWKDQLHAHAISPMQQFAYTTGKNSTDSALIIDAMDLLYAGHLDGFVIVSSDSDFTRLATRLREAGKTVYGVGARKTPQAFRDACDKFTFLEVLRADAAEPQAEPGRERTSRARAKSASREQNADATDAPSESTELVEPGTGTEPGTGLEAGLDAEPAKRNLESMLTKALNRTASDDDDWSALGALGSHLNRTDPSFDARTYGFAKLSDLVKAQPFLETQTVKTSSGQGQLWVRLKRRGAARKAAGTLSAEPTSPAPEAVSSGSETSGPSRASSAAAAPAPAEAADPSEDPSVNNASSEKQSGNRRDQADAEAPVKKAPAKAPAAKRPGRRTTRKVAATTPPTGEQG